MTIAGWTCFFFQFNEPNIEKAEVLLSVKVLFFDASQKVFFLVGIFLSNLIAKPF